ncbi:MAG TPA: TetR/AcrR family transcriptional regulator [Dongiaceae bacterium]
MAAATALVEAHGARNLTLRGLSRQVGVTAPSVYLHFPDLDHLLAAVVGRGFEDLTRAAGGAVRERMDPAEELRARCRAYCQFALHHPHLYQLMFQADLPVAIRNAPEATPGRRSFENLVSAVRRCIDAGVAPAHDDPFRLASLIWTAEHGLVLARMSRPAFPWAPVDALVNEMVDRLMGFCAPAPEPPAATAGQPRRRAGRLQPGTNARQ